MKNLIIQLKDFQAAFAAQPCLDEEKCLNQLRQLHYSVKKGYSQLSDFCGIVEQNLIETYEAELNQWLQNQNVLMGIACSGCLERLTKIMKNDEAQLVLNNLLQTMANFCQLLHATLEKLTQRTPEEQLSLLEQRRKKLIGQSCPRKPLFERVCENYQKAPLSRQDYLNQRTEILERIKEAQARMDADAYERQPLELIRALRQHGLSEENLNQALCTYWQLEELQKLCIDRETEQPEEPQLLFLKSCIAQIQECQWQGKPLVHRKSHWYYVLLYLADRSVMGCNDYEGFCQLLTLCQTPHMPTPSTLSTEAHEFLGGRFPHWKFSRPMSAAARQKMEIGMQMNLIYKKFSYLLQ